MLGLFAFFYASVHLISYVFLLFGGHWSEIFVEVTKRPYIIVGGLAYVLLLPLALTSTRGWQQRLGRRWVRLHLLVYVVAVLVLIHFSWVKKTGLLASWPYALVLGLLFGARIWKQFTSFLAKV
jgi:sulfoxide reductase heme-binding subunit YedZ